MDKSADWGSIPHVERAPVDEICRRRRVPRQRRRSSREEAPQAPAVGIIAPRFGGLSRAPRFAVSLRCGPLAAHRTFVR
jgi:hypothetical protein